jgi:hypothetical protein
MRHTICVTPVRKTAAAAPASRARGVGHAAPARALVALGGIALCSVSRLARARHGAVALATVAVAAQQDLGAAARAQEQTGGTVHTHPGRTEVLDGRVPARHTAVAPPSSARCRARHGHQASRPERPLPCPPSSASGTVVSRTVAAARASVCPKAPAAVSDAQPAQHPTPPTTDSGASPARPPCRAAGLANNDQANELLMSAPAQATRKPKTAGAPSPPNRRGSWAPLTAAHRRTARFAGTGERGLETVRGAPGARGKACWHRG